MVYAAFFLSLRSFFPKNIIFLFEKKRSCNAVSGLISRSQAVIDNAQKDAIGVGFVGPFQSL